MSSSRRRAAPSRFSTKSGGNVRIPSSGTSQAENDRRHGTSTGRNVQTAKKYVGYAASAAEKASGWVAAAKKLEKKGETLSDIQKYLTKLTFVSKISAGLGAASFGLTVLQMFVPVPDKEDQILDGVNEVKRKIDRLEGRIESMLTKMQDTVWTASVQTALESDHLVWIRQATGHLDSIAGNRKKHRSTSYHEKKLLNFDDELLSAAVTEIHQYLVEGATVNLLEMTYNKTYGNPKAIAQLGGYYLQMARMGVAAEASVLALKEKAEFEEKGKTYSPSDSVRIAKQVSGYLSNPSDKVAQLAAIEKAVNYWSKKALRSSGYKANIKRYFSDEGLDPADFLETDCQGSAKTLVQKMSDQFPWFNFSAIVYPGVTGASLHGWYRKGGKSQLLTKKRFQPTAGDKVNIILYYCPRTESKIHGIVDARNQNADSHGRRSLIRTVSKYLNEKKRSRAKRYRRLRAEPSVTYYIKTYYGTDYTKAKNATVDANGVPTIEFEKLDWDGDMLWGHWADESGWQSKLSGFQTIGAAAQTGYMCVRKHSTKSLDSGMFGGPSNRAQYWYDKEYYQVIGFYEN